MDYRNAKVSHKIFGVGTITGQDLKYISVLFENTKVTKRFAYPACFGSFLTFLDPKLNTGQQSEKKKRTLEENSKKRTQEYKQALLKQEIVKDTNIKTFQSVVGFCDEYSKCIAKELVYLQKSKSNRYRIFDGKRIDVSNDHYVYSFETDNEGVFPEGTKITLFEKDKDYNGHIISYEDFTLLIYTMHDFGKDVAELEFSAQPWMLLSSLKERLSEIREKPSKIVESLICDGFKNIDPEHSVLTGQNNAIDLAMHNPISFIWGPPGTGKTETLAKISIEFLKQQKRILMLSYSNVSVDGAILRVHKLLGSKNKPGEILRYGNARDKMLLEHEYLTSSNYVMYDHSDLLAEREKLRKEKKRLSRDSKQLVEINQKLNGLKKKLLDEEKVALKNADFVATTVSMAIMNKTIRSSKFDVVIFDEASMAYIPQLIYSASLASKHFVCMGDFKQLPPIVQSGDDSILNVDIFQYCGIASAVEKGCGHKWLCMLNEQYRMEGSIADFVSKHFYNNLLVTASGITEKRQDVVESMPVENQAIALADLSGMMSVCMKSKDQSNFNILSAFLAFSMALSGSENHQVGIITPYHAQSRLLHSMARDSYKVNPEFNEISCATVHQFQGSEKDIIIYDAVDCYRLQYPGLLLTSLHNSYANRLFNVAMTRARGKFVAVANVDFMKEKNISSKLMFKQLIDQETRNYDMISQDKILENKAYNKALEIVDEKNVWSRFVRDLKQAKKEIQIDIPSKPLIDNDFGKLFKIIDELKKKHIKVMVRVENKEDIPIKYQKYIVQNPNVMNPIVIVDKKIIWYGMPSSFANFSVKDKTEIIPTTCYPYIRFVGSYTANSLYGLLNMSDKADHSKIVLKVNGKKIANTLSSYVLAHTSCPECGEPMMLRKSHKGKYFLGCSAYPKCNGIDFLKTSFLTDCLLDVGTKCPKCGSSLEAKAGPYGLYAKCLGYEHHSIKLDDILIE